MHRLNTTQATRRGPRARVRVPCLITVLSIQSCTLRKGWFGCMPSRAFVCSVRCVIAYTVYVCGMSRVYVSQASYTCLSGARCVSAGKCGAEEGVYESGKKVYKRRRERRYAWAWMDDVRQRERWAVQKVNFFFLSYCRIRHRRIRATQCCCKIDDRFIPCDQAIERTSRSAKTFWNINIYALFDYHKIFRNINICALFARHCGPHSSSMKISILN